MQRHRVFQAQTGSAVGSTESCLEQAATDTKLCFAGFLFCCFFTFLFYRKSGIRSLLLQASSYKPMPTFYIWSVLRMRSATANMEESRSNAGADLALGWASLARRSTIATDGLTSRLALGGRPLGEAGLLVSGGERDRRATSGWACFAQTFAASSFDASSDSPCLDRRCCTKAHWD